MGFQPQFTTSIESRNGVARVALSGELDLATVPMLRGHLAHLEREDVVAIVLDLRDLTFLDCSGLHAFLIAREHAVANEHRLILVGTSARTRRLFELTGTEFLLDDREAVGVLARFTGELTRQADRTETMNADADA